MEHNDFSSTGSSTPQSGSSGTTGMGVSGGSLSSDSPIGSSGSYGSTASTGSTGSTSDTAGLKDRARDLAGNAQDKLADVGSSVRERAGTLKDSLADALETGADKLRSRTTSDQSGQLAGAIGSSSVALAGDERVTQVTNKVAGGMEATADWLRDADLDGMRQGIERQVKEHPGRTLLIAAGLGYLLGKALKK